MSTFDTLCDWREGSINDITALCECVNNLAQWHPEVRNVEAFQAIVEILEKHTDSTWKLYKGECQ